MNKNDMTLEAWKNRQRERKQEEMRMRQSGEWLEEPKSKQPKSLGLTDPFIQWTPIESKHGH